MLRIDLDGSGSSDTDGTIVRPVWTDDLGDTIPDGETVIATLSVGTHTITLPVTDNDGLTNTDAVTITVEPGPNLSPVADAGEDVIANANEEVTLDASASYDHDGQIVQYGWTALPEDAVLYSGDQSSFATRALGRVEEVTKLTVTDDRGGSSEDIVSIFNERVERISQLQAQISALQPQVQLLEQQNAQLQQMVDENRYLLEQLPQLRKKLEELMAKVEEETP